MLGYDVTGDIALIQLEGASNLKTVPIGESTCVKTGDSVAGMGNAEGQYAIVPVAGQVTGAEPDHHRGDQGGSITQETLHNMIQTNANIVPATPAARWPTPRVRSSVWTPRAIGGLRGPAVRRPVTRSRSTTRWRSPADRRRARLARRLASATRPSWTSISGRARAAIRRPRLSSRNGSFGGDSAGGNGSAERPAGAATRAAHQQREPGALDNIANVSSGTLILGTICNGPAAAVGMTAGSVITAVNGQAIGSPDSLTGVVRSSGPATRSR